MPPSVGEDMGSRTEEVQRAALGVQGIRPGLYLHLSVEVQEQRKGVCGLRISSLLDCYRVMSHQGSTYPQVILFSR